MEAHLGYPKHSPTGHHSGNSRNGYGSKSLKGDHGVLEIETPRDRNGTFDLQFVRKNQTRLTHFDDKILTQRQTAFKMPESTNTGSQASIHDIYQALVVNEQRNQYILGDIKQVLAEGRSPIVLTERREHVLLLADQIKAFAKNVFVMQGGMGPSASE